MCLAKKMEKVNYTQKEEKKDCLYCMNKIHIKYFNVCLQDQILPRVPSDRCTALALILVVNQISIGDASKNK